MRIRRYAAIVFTCLLFGVSVLSLQGQVTAVRAGRLVDPDAGTAARNQVILIENGKITAVGSGLAIPAGAKVVNLSRMTVLPGLFDCHSHLCTTVPESNRDLFTADMKQSSAYRAILGTANAKAMLESGFTTVRDVGNAGLYIDTSLRNAIDQQIIPGPTIINAGRIIAPFGGQYHLQPERGDLGQPEYLYADTRDEMRKAIRENVHFGARVIKIVVDDQPYIYSVDDIKFIVQEAANAGVKVAAHCMTEQGAKNAAEGGVASIEHGFRMSDEALMLAKRNNVVLVGTDFTLAAAGYLGLPPDIAKQFHDVFVDRLRRAYKIGVTMAFGTDTFFAVAGEDRGTLAVSFIDSFVEAGIPAKDTLKIMTTNAAKLLGVEKQRGAIKAGQFADIIATPEDPLENIQTLKKVSFVMKNGKIIRSTDK